MAETTPIYFVEGGTGIQGGAVIDHLLKLKPTPVIRTLSRDLSSQAVQKLRERGVEVIEGGQDDKEAMKKGVAGAVGAFSVQMVIFGPKGIDGEREASDAQKLVEACKESGTVKHIVHTSVQSTGFYETHLKAFVSRFGMAAYYEGKLGAEAAVRNSGLKYTILRPAYFSSNYLASKASFGLPGLVKSEYYTTTDSLAHIVTDDIGAFAVAAFLNPDKFNGREIELVGEHLTAEQIVEALEAASGKKIKILRFTQEEAEAHPDQGWKMPQFVSNLQPKKVDIEALKREYPEVKFGTFKDYIIRHKDELAVGTQQ